MAKDKGGHGSEKRGGAAEVGELGSQHSSNFRAGVQPMSAETAHNLLGRPLDSGLNPGGTSKANPEVGELGSAHSSNSGEAHVASIAAQHGVSTVHLTGVANPDHIWAGQMRGAQRVAFGDRAGSAGKVGSTRADVMAGAGPSSSPSMRGGKSVVPRDVAANFAKGGKYGAPSKGFASGKREINSLRAKGK